VPHDTKRDGQKAASGKTAGIYARFSCSKQREASIEDQLRVCREWCEREGYEVVAEYSDFAMSGRSADRPQFQEMIRNAGESDIVLVYMMDRFSRDVYDAPIYKKKLKAKGVRVVSATEAMPDGPESILIESIYEAMAAMESAHTSQRVRRGMEGNALKCLHNGDSLYGYDVGKDGHYVINEVEAEVVREVFSRKANGEPVNSIAADLARRGVTTKKGNRPTYGFVYNMLRREKYTGVYIWGDVRVEGGMPAIVTREEFAMARDAKVRKDRSREDWGDYPLVGRCLCLSCGQGLVGTSGRGRNGAKYDYYRCGKKCGCKAVRADWLEGTIVEVIRSMLSDRDEAMHVAQIVEELSRDDAAEARAKDATRRREKAERGIANLMDAIAEGLDPSIALPKVEELRSQAAAAAREEQRLATMRRFDAEDFADFLQHGSTLTDEALLEGFVWQVWVGDDDVVVTLSYDRNENEPARLGFSRVRKDSKWWTTRIMLRNKPIEVGWGSGYVLLGFPRSA